MRKGEDPPVYLSAGATHVGLVRSSNQDAFIELGAAGLWAVADGMGGYRDGDVAARMVCAALTDLEPDLSLEEAVGEARRRVAEVNARLYQASVRPVNPVMSGSTVVVLLARGALCAVLWAGDSRAYRLRGGRLARLTTDHTWAAELKLEQAAYEGDHAITRAVGGEHTLALDLRRDHVRRGDRYLLCSDGLTRELADVRIAALLGSGGVRDCADALVAATLEAGARDNVTAVVVDVQ